MINQLDDMDGILYLEELKEDSCSAIAIKRIEEVQAEYR